MSLYSNLKHFFRGTDVEALLRDNQEKEKKLFDAMCDVKKLTNDNNSISTNINILMHENVELKDKVQKGLDALKELNKIIVDKDGDISLLKEKVQTYSDLVNELTKQCQLLNVRSEEQSRLITEMEDLNNKFKSENESLVRKVAALEDIQEELVKKELLIENLEYELGIKEQQCKDANNREEEWKKRSETLEADFKALQPYLYLIEEKKAEEQAAQELEKAKEEITVAINEYKEIQISNGHKDLYNRLQQSLDEATCLLKKKTISHSDVQTGLERLKENIIKIREEEENLLLQEKEERIKAEKLLEEEENKGRAKLVLQEILIQASDYLKEIPSDLDAKDIILFLEENIQSAQETYEKTTASPEIYENASQKLESAFKQARKKITQREDERNHVVQRRIPEVFDAQTGEYIQAYQFFSRPEGEVMKWRRIFETSIQLNEKRFLCPYCRQMVKISGRKFMRGAVSFFSHLHDSHYCEIKTTTGLTKEQIEARKYGLVTESERHRQLKTLISEALSSEISQQKGVSDVVVEKKVDSFIPGLNWRRPDVLARYKGMNLVFELQLSTTFISVVVQRDIFYRLNKYFIIWVFNFDENEKFVDLTNLMCKDIYYGNKRNIFVFDREAQVETERRGELVLKCNWLDSDSKWHYQGEQGSIGGQFVTLDELKYDEETYKPFYFDADSLYYEAHPEVKSRILHEEKAYQEKCLKKWKDEQNDDWVATRQQAEERLAQQEATLKWMQEHDESATIYQVGNKYGLRYNEVVLVPPNFSSCQWSKKYGMFLVSYRRKYGLYDRFGQVYFSCDYLAFHRLDNGMIVAENTQGFYLRNIGKISERIVHDTILLEILSPEVSAITVNKYRKVLFLVDGDLLFKQNEQGSYAFYSFLGDLLSDETYSEYRFTEKYEALWLRESTTGLWKIVNIDRTSRTNKRYEGCRFEKNKVIAQQLGQTDIYALDGGLVRETEFDYIMDFGQQYEMVCKDKLYGLVDIDFLEVVPICYTDIKRIKEFILVQNVDGCWGILDKTGKTISEPEFDQITPFYYNRWDNYLRVFKDEKQGVCNDKGIVIPADYEDIDECDDYLRTRRIGKYGLYDRDGHELLSCVYDQIYSLVKGMSFRCQIGEKWHIYFLDRMQLDDTSYDKLDGIGITYIKAQSGEKVMLMDSGGRICIPDDYDDIEYWRDDVFKVFRDNRCGLYAITEGLLTELKYLSISHYSKGKTMVTVTDGDTIRKGHIDDFGKEIYSSTQTLTDGTVAKLFFGKWGLYDTEERVVIPMEYDGIDYIGHGLYKVHIDGKTGVKSGQNNYILQPIFRDIESNDDTPYIIGKLIKYKRVREYTYGRSYHMIDEEYNEYQLFSLDGTQNDIPAEYRGSFASIKLGGQGFIWINGCILSLSNFCISDNGYSSCEPSEIKDFWIVSKGNKKFGLLNKAMQQVLPCNFDTIIPWGNGIILTNQVTYSWNYWNRTMHNNYALYKQDGTICSIGRFLELPKQMEDGKIEIVRSDGVGYIDLNGEIIPDSEEKMNDEIIVRKSFNRLEVVDLYSRVLIAWSEGVKSIKMLTKGVYTVLKDGKFGMFSVDKGVFVHYQYVAIELWAEDIVKACNPGLYYGSSDYVLLSIDGQPISDKKYSKIESLEQGKAIACRDGITGQLNDKGQEIYDTAESIKKGYLKVRIFGKWGVLDASRRETLPCIYTAIEVFDDDKLLLCLDSRKILTDWQGKSLIDAEFSEIDKLENGFFVLKQYGRCALFDETYKVIVPYAEGYSFMALWGDSLFLAEKKEMTRPYLTTYCLLDREGKLVTCRRYTSIGALQDGQAEAVDLDNLKGILNSDGQEVVDSVVHFSDTVTAYGKFSKYELKEGDELLLSGVYEILPLSNGLLRIKKEAQRHQLYSLSQKKYIGSEYQDISDFTDGKAKVIKSGRKGLIDKDGNVLPTEELQIGENLRKAKFIGMWRIVDNDNKQVVDGEYIEIGSYKGRYIGFSHNGFKILNIKCHEKIPVQGEFYRKEQLNLIYKVSECNIYIRINTLKLDSMNISEYINENRKLNIYINRIYSKYIYGRPYEKETPRPIQEPFNMGERIVGHVCKIYRFGLRLQTSDGKETFIHVSRLKKFGYENVTFKKGQSLTLVKVGVDEVHQNDLWDIEQ